MSRETLRTPFTRAWIALNCKSRVASRRETEGGSRDARRVRRNSVEKRRTAKNRRKFCICEIRTRHPSDVASLSTNSFSRVLSPLIPLVRYPHVVALAVAYRYGYGIRHTSQSTNGYFAETTSRFLQEMPSPPGRERVITNDEGGKSRSNFPLREPKEAFGSTNSGGSVEWQTTYLTHKNNNENILRWRN